MKYPYYNPYTDEIVDCTKGTSVWHHEDRHRQQYQTRVVKMIFKFETYTSQIFAMLMCLGFVELFIFRKDVGLGTIYISGIYYALLGMFNFIIEIDAWIYQFRMMLRRRREE